MRHLILLCITATLCSCQTSRAPDALDRAIEDIMGSLSDDSGPSQNELMMSVFNS